MKQVIFEIISNEALTKEVNVVLAELKADGTLDQIVAKYINAN